MPLVHKDRVKETTTTTGTGTLTLAGAVSGFQSFAAIGDGNTCHYAIVGGTEWETGVGTYTASGTTLARTSVLASSNSNSAVNLSAGTKEVFVTLPGAKLPAGDIVGTSDTQILTGKTLTDPVIVGAILEDIYTISDGAAFEVDPGNGTIQLITLGANRTPKATSFTNGESVTLMVDDGTAYTLTWTDATWGGSGVVWKTNSGSAPTLNTTGYTVIQLWKVGDQVYGARVGDA
jgi:hypothetical protein